MPLQEEAVRSRILIARKTNRSFGIEKAFDGIRNQFCGLQNFAIVVEG
jgi:hypothetical protein